MSRFDKDIRKGRVAKEAKRLQSAVDMLDQPGTKAKLVISDGDSSVSIALDPDDVKLDKLLAKHLRKAERKLED